ncbi:MAG: inner membrane CreD family protein, partial [Pseudomonadota bacterium]
LVALYGTLFMILRSTDYALLAGSVLAFVAVALVMILTRRDQWYPDMPAPGDPAK